MACLNPIGGNGLLLNRSGLAAAAVGVAVLVAGISALRAHSHATSPVAVLVIEEANGGILAQRPAKPAAPRLMITQPAQQGEEPGDGGDVPGVEVSEALLPLVRGTRLLVYQSIDSGLELVEDRLWTASTLPFRADTGAPAATDGDRNLVQNERRLGPDAVEVIALDGTGRLALRVRDAEVTLQPGEQWVEGRTLQAGKPEALDSTGWEAAVTAALESRAALTVTRITYLGLLPRSRIGPLTR